MVAAHAEKPGQAVYWQMVIKNDLERIRKRFPLQSRAFHMRQTFGSQARAFLDKKGYRLSGETLDMFIEEFVRTELQAARQLEHNAGGDWREDPDAKRFAPPEVLANDGKVDAMDMFERYADEAQIDDKTRRSWRIKLKSLMTFVGHDDLANRT